MCFSLSHDNYKNKFRFDKYLHVLEYWKFCPSVGSSRDFLVSQGFRRFDPTTVYIRIVKWSASHIAARRGDYLRACDCRQHTAPLVSSLLFGNVVSRGSFFSWTWRPAAVYRQACQRVSNAITRKAFCWISCHFWAPSSPLVRLFAQYVSPPEIHKRCRQRWANPSFD